MKKVRLTTTEFYKNPSKAINIVKEGGVVYLAYKNLKDPIAEIRQYEKEDQEPEYQKNRTELGKKRMAIIEKYLKENKGKRWKWKSGLDLQRAVRQ